MTKVGIKYNLDEIILDLNQSPPSSGNYNYFFPKYIVDKVFRNDNAVKQWFNDFYYYNDNTGNYYLALDTYTRLKYGSFFPIVRLLKPEESKLANFSSTVRVQTVIPFLMANRDKIKHFIDIYNVEYNPIDNYDKTSTITTEKQGTETNIDNFSQGKTTNIIGGKTTTETGKNAPYETDSDFVNDTRTTVEESGNTDTTTTDAKTDSHTLSFEGRMDIVTERTRGNIGVTTSAQMLKGELEFWNSYCIMDFIMTEYVKQFCVLIDED